MRKNSQILYEIALKLVSDDLLIEHSLKNASVRGMLIEKLDDADVQKLRTAVGDTMDAVNNNLKIATAAKLDSLAKYFTSVKASLGKADELVSKFDLADPEGMASKLKGFFGKKIDVPRALSAVIDLQNKVNAAVDTMGGALTLIIRNLEGKVDGNVKLSDLNKDEHGIGVDQLKAGISKAFKASRPGGFMAKLGGMLSKAKLPKIPGAEKIDDFPIESLSAEILGLTFAELKNIGNSAEASAAAADAAAVPADAIKDIAAPAVDAAATETEEAPPEEESSPAEEIDAVAAAAAATPTAPKDAVAKALGDWEASLSASSQKVLQAKKRNQALKDAIFTGIDKGKKAVQNAVAKAIKGWRAEHEETLIKSKRFAKKNFDSLQTMIPQLASQVLAQANENNQRKITRREIKGFIYKRLNEKYFPSGILYEKWQKNAGLLKD